MIHPRVVARTLAAALFLVPLLATRPAGAQDAAPTAGALATVDGTTITASDVDAVIRTRGPGAFGGDPETAEQRALETLVAEELVAARLGRDESALGPQVRTAIADARRQILFNGYVRARFTPPEPTDEEMDAYVADNPHAFDERVVYRFQQVLVPAADPDTRATVQSLLAALEAAEPVDETTLAAWTKELAEAGVRFSSDLAWRGTETMPEPLRARLAGLAQDPGNLDVRSLDDGFAILALFSARAAPVDPALVREEIRARLVEAAFAAHRERVVASLAREVLDAGGAVALVRPLGLPRPAVLTALGLLGFALALVPAAFAQWSRVLVRRFHYLIEMGRVGGIAFYTRPAFGWTVTALVSLAATGAAVWAASLVWDRVGLRETGALVAGGLVLGALLATLALISQTFGLRRRVVAAGIALACLAVYAVMVAAVAFAGLV